MADSKRKTFTAGDKAVIDTCILHDRFLRSVVMYLVAFGYLHPVISQMILEELKSSLYNSVGSMTEAGAEAIAQKIEGRFAAFGVIPAFTKRQNSKIDKIKPHTKDPYDAHVLFIATQDNQRLLIISDNVDDLRGYKNVPVMAVDTLVMSMLDSKKIVAVNGAPYSGEKITITESELAKDALAYAGMAVWPKAKTFLDAIVNLNERHLFVKLRELISSGEPSDLTPFGEHMQKRVDRFILRKKDLMSQIS